MTANAQLEAAIEAAWEARDQITPATTGETREAIEDTLNALDGGGLRVAEKQDDGKWHVNQWAKKAVLLGFRLKDMEMQSGAPQGASWFDKVDSKFAGWGPDEWGNAGFRAVPGAIARKSAYIAPGVVQWERGSEIMALPLREAREMFERDYLLAQVTRFGGNISKTASFIGMERSALHRKLKLLGISQTEKGRGMSA